MDYIKVGVIVNTHGLKGTAKVKSFTDFKEERYKTGTPLYILYKNEYIKVTVSKYKTVKGLEHINFDEIKHINDCEKYKGSELYINKELIHTLTTDEFYYKELIGMIVHGEEELGEVIDVREVPQGELLEVKRAEGKNVLIPFNKQFVKHVDKQKGIITLEFWEGLY